MKKMRIFLIYAVIFVSVLGQGCDVKNTIDRKTISVSIYPQEFLVKALLGDNVTVNTMVTKGNSPATYSPTPDQIKEINRSYLYLKIGHIGFEQAWSDRFMALNEGLKMIDTSEGLELISEEDYVHGNHVHSGGVDPHFWTSPKAMLHVLRNTEKALIDGYPEYKELIHKNKVGIEELLKEQDRKFEESLKSVNNKSFLIFHPAYTYLANDYGLVQISIENKGKEPGIQWLQKIMELANHHNIKVIFVQEEFDKKNAQIISEELNIPIVSVNPLAKDWDVEMNNLLDKLLDALR